MKIAIGPARDFPSWHWCGGDLVSSLRLSHDIKVFRWYSELVHASVDAVVVIKEPPYNRWSPGSTKTVYLPVDFFESHRAVIEGTAKQTYERLSEPSDRVRIGAADFAAPGSRANAADEVT